jgi:hypothetical protein
MFATMAKAIEGAGAAAADAGRAVGKAAAASHAPARARATATAAPVRARSAPASISLRKSSLSPTVRARNATEKGANDFIALRSLPSNDPAKLQPVLAFDLLAAAHDDRLAKSNEAAVLASAEQARERTVAAARDTAQKQIDAARQGVSRASPALKQAAREWADLTASDDPYATEAAVAHAAAVKRSLDARARAVEKQRVAATNAKLETVLAAATAEQNKAEDAAFSQNALGYKLGSTSVAQVLRSYAVAQRSGPRAYAATQLQNLVGSQLGLRPTAGTARDDPRAALYTSGPELAKIDRIMRAIDQIGGPHAKLTVVPIVYGSAQTGVQETVLFQVKDGSGSKVVDSNGSIHDNFGAFQRHNQLTPGSGRMVALQTTATGKIAYDPKGNAKLYAGAVHTQSGLAAFVDGVGNFVSSHLSDLSMAAGVLSQIAGGVLEGVTLGAGTPLAAALEIGGEALEAGGEAAFDAGIAYNTVQAGSTIVHMAERGESLNPFASGQARAAWFGLIASGAGTGGLALGLGSRVLGRAAETIAAGTEGADAAGSLASEGSDASDIDGGSGDGPAASAPRTFVRTSEKLMVGKDAAPTLARVQRGLFGTAFVAGGEQTVEAGYHLAKNWNHLSWSQRLGQAAQMGFNFLPALAGGVARRGTEAWARLSDGPLRPIAGGAPLPGEEPGDAAATSALAAISRAHPDRNAIVSSRDLPEAQTPLSPLAADERLLRATALLRAELRLPGIWLEGAGRDVLPAVVGVPLHDSALEGAAGEYFDRLAARHPGTPFALALTFEDLAAGSPRLGQSVLDVKASDALAAARERGVPLILRAHERTSSNAGEPSVPVVWDRRDFGRAMYLLALHGEFPILPSGLDRLMHGTENERNAFEATLLRRSARRRPLEVVVANLGLRGAETPSPHHLQALRDVLENPLMPRVHFGLSHTQLTSETLNLIRDFPARFVYHDAAEDSAAGPSDRALMSALDTFLPDVEAGRLISGNLALIAARAEILQDDSTFGLVGSEAYDSLSPEQREQFDAWAKPKGGRTPTPLPDLPVNLIAPERTSRSFAQRPDLTHLYTELAADGIRELRPDGPVRGNVNYPPQLASMFERAQPVTPQEFPLEPWMRSVLADRVTFTRDVLRVLPPPPDANGDTPPEWTTAALDAADPALSYHADLESQLDALVRTEVIERRDSLSDGETLFAADKEPSVGSGARSGAPVRELEVVPAPAGTTMASLLEPTGKAEGGFVKLGQLRVQERVLSDFKRALTYLDSGSNRRPLDVLYNLMHADSVTEVHVSQIDGFTFGGKKNALVEWAPRAAHHWDNGATSSPAVLLSHEMEHALAWHADRSKFLSDKQPYSSGSTLNEKWKSPEERRIVQGPDRRLSRELGEGVRYRYRPGAGHRAYATADPRSREPATTIYLDRLRQRDDLALRGSVTSVEEEPGFSSITYTSDDGGKQRERNLRLAHAAGVGVTPDRTGEGDVPRALLAFPKEIPHALHDFASGLRPGDRFALEIDVRHRNLRYTIESASGQTHELRIGPMVAATDDARRADSHDRPARLQPPKAVAQMPEPLDRETLFGATTTGDQTPPTEGLPEDIRGTLPASFRFRAAQDTRDFRDARIEDGQLVIGRGAARELIDVESAIGPLLGHGNQKIVFALGARRAVGILARTSDPLAETREVEGLNRLRRLGFRAARAEGGLRVAGQPAILYHDRYVLSTRTLLDPKTQEVLPRIVTQQTIDDLREITKMLVEKGVGLGSTEFLFSPDGRLTISDPTSVHELGNIDPALTGDARYEAEAAVYVRQAENLVTIERMSQIFEEALARRNAEQATQTARLLEPTGSSRGSVFLGNALRVRRPVFADFVAALNLAGHNPAAHELLSDLVHGSHRLEQPGASIDVRRAAQTAFVVRDDGTAGIDWNPTYRASDDPAATPVRELLGALYDAREWMMRPPQPLSNAELFDLAASEGEDDPTDPFAASGDEPAVPSHDRKREQFDLRIAAAPPARPRVSIPIFGDSLPSPKASGDLLRRARALLDDPRRSHVSLTLSPRNEAEIAGRADLLGALVELIDANPARFASDSRDVSVSGSHETAPFRGALSDQTRASYLGGELVPAGDQWLLARMVPAGMHPTGHAPPGTTLDTLLASNGAIDGMEQLGRLKVATGLYPDFVSAQKHLARVPQALDLLHNLRNGSANVEVRHVWTMTRLESHDDGKLVVNWAPREAVRNANGTASSPAMGLYHELLHAQSWLADPIGTIDRSRAYRPDSPEARHWPNPDERRTIRLENAVAKRLPGEGPRAEYANTPYFARAADSTEPGFMLLLDPEPAGAVSTGGIVTGTSVRAGLGRIDYVRDDRAAGYVTFEHPVRDGLRNRLPHPLGTARLVRGDRLTMDVDAAGKLLAYTIAREDGTTVRWEDAVNDDRKGGQVFLAMAPAFAAAHVAAISLPQLAAAGVGAFAAARGLEAGLRRWRERSANDGADTSDPAQSRFNVRKRIAGALIVGGTSRWVLALAGHPALTALLNHTAFFSLGLIGLGKYAANRASSFDRLGTDKPLGRIVTGIAGLLHTVPAGTNVDATSANLTEATGIAGIYRPIFAAYNALLTWRNERAALAGADRVKPNPIFTKAMRYGGNFLPVAGGLDLTYLAAHAANPFGAAAIGLYTLGNARLALQDIRPDPTDPVVKFSRNRSASALVATGLVGYFGQSLLNLVFPGQVGLERATTAKVPPHQKVKPPVIMPPRPVHHKAPKAPPPAQLVVTANAGVYDRAAPSTRAKILGTLRAGSLVRPTGRHATTAGVRFEVVYGSNNGKPLTGWVAAEYLRVHREGAMNASGDRYNPALTGPRYVAVTVEPGDTLASIAARNNADLAETEKLNDQIADPNVIYPGDTVYLRKSAERLHHGS